MRLAGRVVVVTGWVPALLAVPAAPSAMTARNTSAKEARPSLTCVLPSSLSLQMEQGDPIRLAGTCQHRDVGQAGYRLVTSRQHPTSFKPWGETSPGGSWWHPAAPDRFQSLTKKALQLQGFWSKAHTGFEPVPPP